MKNQDKKILLFAIATLVTFFGIGHVLLKGTSATDTLSNVPANPAFDDINFYKCVVDAYNDKNNKSVSYDTNLNDLQLSTINKLDCPNKDIVSANGLEKITNLWYLYIEKNKLTEIDLVNNTKLSQLKVTDNQLTELDVSNNKSLQILYAGGNNISNLNLTNNINLTDLRIFDNDLTDIDLSHNVNLYSLFVGNNNLTNLNLSDNVKLASLDVRNNQLTELDVSQNNKLTQLHIGDKDFGNVYNVYINGTCILNENIKLPTGVIDENSKWSVDSSNSKIIGVDETSGVVTANNIGTVKVWKTHFYYSVKYYHTINVVEITSEKYKIDEDNSYIFIGTDSDINVIKNNISKSHDNVNVDIDLDNNKLYVKYDEEILKEFKIIRTSFNDFDVLNDNINISGDVTYNE